MAKKHNSPVTSDRAVPEEQFASQEVAPKTKQRKPSSEADGTWDPLYQFFKELLQVKSVPRPLVPKIKGMTTNEYALRGTQDHKSWYYSYEQILECAKQIRPKLVLAISKCETTEHKFNTAKRIIELALPDYLKMKEKLDAIKKKQELQSQSDSYISTDEYVSLLCEDKTEQTEQKSNSDWRDNYSSLW